MCLGPKAVTSIVDFFYKALQGKIIAQILTMTDALCRLLRVSGARAKVGPVIYQGVSMTERSEQDIKRAAGVGHIPSGLFVVTTHEDGVSDGYLASWVQQVSFSPLLVSLAINESRPGYQRIKDGKTFTINIVGDHEMGYLKHFWKGYSPSENPFPEIEHELTAEGGVAISRAIASIDCQLESSIKPGDHEIVIAKVLASRVHTTEGKSKVHLRKSGLDY